MKWFKHISDSLDDPFIFDLVSRHGPLGYMVFFGVLEIYAREFKTEPGWNLRITWHYLRTKLQQTRNKRMENVLSFLKVSGKWSVVLDKEGVEIYIPKFSKLLDETTKKKLRTKEQNSGIDPEDLRTIDRDREEDKEEEIRPPQAPPEDREPPDETSDGSSQVVVVAEQIREFRQRYSEQNLIDEVILAFKSTRKGFNIADGIVLGELRWWEQYPADLVQACMQVYLDGDHAGQGRAEKYLRGIIRNHANDPAMQRRLKLKAPGHDPFTAFASKGEDHQEVA